MVCDKVISSSHQSSSKSYLICCNDLRFSKTNFRDHAFVKGDVTWKALFVKEKKTQKESHKNKILKNEITILKVGRSAALNRYQ